MKILAALSVAGVLFGAAGMSGSGIEPGMPLAAFEIRTVDGGTASLDELRAGAKLTIVVFWASWSESSMKELETLGELARYQESGLRVIAVNVENERPDDQELSRVREAAAGLPEGFHVLLDEELSVFREYGVYAVPTTFLADEYGIVTFRLPGFPIAGGTRMVDSIRGTMENRTALAGPWSYRPKPRAVRYHYLGLLLLRKGDVEMAVHTLERAVAIDPEFVSPRALLGDIEKRAERYQLALTHYAAALDYNPDDARILADSGECLLMLGRSVEGQERIQRALDQDPGDGLIHALLALGHALGGRHEQADAAFEQAARLAPLEYRVHKLWARSYELRGEKAASVEEYWRAYDLLAPAVQLEPSSPRDGATDPPEADG